MASRADTKRMFRALLDDTASEGSITPSRLLSMIEMVIDQAWDTKQRAYELRPDKATFYRYYARRTNPVDSSLAITDLPTLEALFAAPNSRTRSTDTVMMLAVPPDGDTDNVAHDYIAFPTWFGTPTRLAIAFNAEGSGFPVTPTQIAGTINLENYNEMGTIEPSIPHYIYSSSLINFDKWLFLEPVPDIPYVDQ